MDCKKNVVSQASKILHHICHAYETGVLDDSTKSVKFCSLLALICEGKVEGTKVSDNQPIKWQLTPEYNSEIQSSYDNFFNALTKSSASFKI